MALKQGINEKVEYQGAVLTTREENYYDDSDFYAVVWDEETQSVKKVYYDTTRCYQYGFATVDATPEVEQKARKWLYRWALAVALNEAERKAISPEKGREVVVKLDFTKSQKHFGKVGKVLWKGEIAFDKYGRDNTVRIKFLPNDGSKSVYLSAFQAETLNPEPVDIEEVMLTAADFAKSGGFYVPFVGHSVVVV